MGGLPRSFSLSYPDFFWTMLRCLCDVSNAKLRTAFMNKGVRHGHAVALAIWQSGDLVGHVSPEDFASMINTYFGGALGLWSDDNIDAAVFFAHIRHAMAISLLECGNKQWEARLVAEVAAARAVNRP